MINKYIVQTEFLKHNINVIKKRTSGKPIMGIVKCNGYGMGLIEYSEFLLSSGIDLLGVSCFEEATALREAGIDSDIVLLTSYSDTDILKAVVKNNITATVGSVDAAKKLEAAGKQLSVVPNAHLEINTGMGRCGFDPSDIQKILSLKDLKIDISGTFSHFSFSFAKSDKYVLNQLNIFLDTVKALNDNNFKTGVLHIANSNAAMRYEKTHLDMVRIGSALLGRIENASAFGLKKVGILSSEVIELNHLKKGSNVGYANTFKVKRDTDTAIVPVGYADGFATEKMKDTYRFTDRLRYIKNGLFPGKLCACVNGETVPILGRTGMFNIILDVTGKGVKPGDKVTLNANPILLDSRIKREFI